MIGKAQNVELYYIIFQKLTFSTLGVKPSRCQTMAQFARLGRDELLAMVIDLQADKVLNIFPISYFARR